MAPGYCAVNAAFVADDTDTLAEEDLSVDEVFDESIAGDILDESVAEGILTESIFDGIVESGFDGILVESGIDGTLVESIVTGVLRESIFADTLIESVVNGFVFAERAVESTVDEVLSTAGVVGRSVALYGVLQAAKENTMATANKIVSFIYDIF